MARTAKRINAVAAVVVLLCTQNTPKRLRMRDMMMLLMMMMSFRAVANGMHCLAAISANFCHTQQSQLTQMRINMVRCFFFEGWLAVVVWLFFVHPQKIVSRNSCIPDRVCCSLLLVFHKRAGCFFVCACYRAPVFLFINMSCWFWFGWFVCVACVLASADGDKVVIICMLFLCSSVGLLSRVFFATVCVRNET